jgi:uncharacterized protein
MRLDVVPIDRIEALAGRIAAAFRPERIVLFGSYADGRPERGSDVDLLVVVDDGGHPLSKAAEISAAIDHEFPLDIVVRNPADYRRRLSLGDWFLRSIEENGRVLYESAH